MDYPKYDIKTEYLRANLEITAFHEEDVIITSSLDDPNMEHIIIQDD